MRSRGAIRLFLLHLVFSILVNLLSQPSSAVDAAAATPTSSSSSSTTSTRSWSYICLCAIEEFRQGCLADARRMCADPTNATIRLSEGSCAETGANHVGYFTLHEIDIKCKHPYTYDTYEAYAAIKALGFTNIDYAKLNKSDVDGKVLFGLTIEQAEHMGLSVGAAKHLVEDVKQLFEPHVPVGDDSLTVHQPSSVSVAVVIREVHDVDELDFSFKIKFTVYFAWRDTSMWVKCDDHGDAIEEGKCGFLWRPRPTWANAREVRIVDSRLQSFPETSNAMLELTVDGHFAAKMSFYNYPKDSKDLEVQFWLTSLAENRQELVFFPVVASFGNEMIDGGNGEKYDALSGWKPTMLSIVEESHSLLDVGSLTGDKDSSDVSDSGAFVGLVSSLQSSSSGRKNGSDSGGTMEVSNTNIVSKMTFSVRVTRTTRFYMLNYVLIVATLTAISWVVFVIPSQQLSNRCTISLTLILALNVFQLIINDSTPKTNYLSPMHEFIISSTFFVVLTAIESVAVHIASRRLNLKSAVVRRIIQRTYQDKRRSKGFVQFMGRLTSIRRRNAARNNWLVAEEPERDEEEGGKGMGEDIAAVVKTANGEGDVEGDVEVEVEVEARNGAKSNDGEEGEKKKEILDESSSRPPQPSGDDDDNTSARPTTLRKRAMAERHVHTPSRHPYNVTSSGGGGYDDDELGDGDDSMEGEQKRGFDRAKKDPFSAFERVNLTAVGTSVTLTDWMDSWLANRADEVSFVIFPLAYAVTMCYIFLMEHS